MQHRARDKIFKIASRMMQGITRFIGTFLGFSDVLWPIPTPLKGDFLHFHKGYENGKSRHNFESTNGEF